MVPQAAPEQPGPATLQLTTWLGFEFGAGVSVAVYAAEAPVFTVVGPPTVSVKLLVTVIAAPADFEGSATLRAVSVTLAGDGRICGAVKSPPESTVPQAAPEQPGPDTLQFTAWLGLPEPLTPAANCRVAPSSTLALPGVTLTARSLIMVAAAEALFEGSATLRAVSVTLAGKGRFGGAEKSPPESTVPQAAPEQPDPDTLQFTLVFVVLVTVAVKGCVAPRKTEAVAGETLTLIGCGGGPGLLPVTPQPVTPEPKARIVPRRIIERLAGLAANPAATLAMTCAKAKTVPRRNFELGEAQC